MKKWVMVLKEQWLKITEKSQIHPQTSGYWPAAGTGVWSWPLGGVAEGGEGQCQGLGAGASVWGASDPAGAENMGLTLQMAQWPS